MQAQSILIKGRVIDDDTEEGVPFCDVFFEDTNVGVSTDMDGYYEIETENYGDSLAVSALGYETARKAISSDPEQTINFRLGEAGFELMEVVVLAGENPANAFVRGIIDNKKKNDLNNLPSYKVEEYSKVELDLVNIKKLKDSKVMKPFQFIFDNIDSLSDEKPYLPAYILESISDVYHSKGNGKPKTILQARRVSGVSNATVNEFINSMHEDFSVYDNWIKILEKPFVSPFSDMGLFTYEYYIMDSTFIENQWAYKLKFKPKRKQENTFFGNFWVIDTTYAVQRLDMRMSPDVNINLVNRIIVYQEYGLIDSLWLPEKQKVVIDFSPTKNDNTMGIIGRKTVSYKDYEIDKPEIREAYKEKDPEDYFKIKDLEKDDAFWDGERHEELSENEKKIYQMVDSVKNVPIYRTYVDVINTVFSGYKKFGPVELGPYFGIFSTDPVQGPRVSLGAWTSNDFSKWVRFGGYAAYGFKDKEWKYGADLMWILSKRPRAHIELAYLDDVSLSSESTEDFQSSNLLSGLYRRRVYMKLIRTKEGKAAIEKYWKKGWSNRVTFLHRRMDPYGNLNADGEGFNYGYIPDITDPVTMDTTIATTEVIVKLRYAYKEKWLEGEFFRTSLGSRYPIMELQYAKGIKGILGSRYNYHKLTFGMRGWFTLNPIGWTRYRVKAGKTFGTVPYLLAEVHPGNETYFYDTDAFNGLDKYEFASDTYASLIIDHHFDGFILNRIPGIRKLKWRTVATFRTLWGTMSDENLAANAPNLYDEDANARNTYIGFQVPNRRPYMEAGVGIENIFKLLRVDVMWRLNYLEREDVKPFTFRLGVDFNF